MWAVPCFLQHQARHELVKCQKHCFTYTELKSPWLSLYQFCKVDCAISAWNNQRFKELKVQHTFSTLVMSECYPKKYDVTSMLTNPHYAGRPSFTQYTYSSKPGIRWHDQEQECSKQMDLNFDKWWNNITNLLLGYHALLYIVHIPHCWDNTTKHTLSSTLAVPVEVGI